MSVACSQRSANSGPIPAVVENARQEASGRGLEATGNFDAPAASIDFLCFAARPLEMPADYNDMRFRRSGSEGCGFNQEKWDILSYRPEAVAGERVGVTPELAGATVERARFVVAHEEVHDQPAIQRLARNVQEPLATFAAFLVAASSNEEALQLSELFLRKSQLTNAYHAQLGRLYERYRRGELTRTGALSLKGDTLSEFERECLALPQVKAFDTCPTVLNNAGVSFDSTYTQLYPWFHGLLTSVGGEREKALELALTDSPRLSEINSAPRKALEELARQAGSPE